MNIYRNVIPAQAHILHCFGCRHLELEEEYYARTKAMEARYVKQNKLVYKVIRSGLFTADTTRVLLSRVLLSRTYLRIQATSRCLVCLAVRTLPMYVRVVLVYSGFHQRVFVV
jgi:hypothetical protein